MTVRVYRSSDSGAPSITRAAGSLITLLDAVLVNGYGAKSPLGWTKAFSGTNTAMYRQGAGSTQRYLYIDDTIVDYASTRGVANPTSITTITADAFPDTSRYIHKPDTGWFIVGNEKGFYLFTKRASWGANNGSFWFGDLASVGGSADIGRSTHWATGSTIATTDGPTTDPIGTLSISVRCAGLRSGIGFVTDAYPAVMAIATDFAAPCTFANAFLFAPVLIYYAAGGVHAKKDVRGFMPGLYGFLHNYPEVTLANGAQITGAGPYTGKTFEVVQLWHSANQASVRMVVEISDTWGN